MDAATWAQVLGDDRVVRVVWARGAGAEQYVAVTVRQQISPMPKVLTFHGPGDKVVAEIAAKLAELEPRR